MPMQITTDKARWYEDSDGFWIAFRTKDRVSSAELAKLVAEGWQVDCSKQKRKRSLDANAYAWVLIDKLATVLQKPKTEIYKQYIKDVGGNSETVCVVNKAVDKLCSSWSKNGLGWQTDTMASKIDGCTNVILYYGSSEYDTRQMSRLINLIVEDCKMQGIETMTPDELSALLDRWEGK